MQIHLHLGAHKTATTSLQGALQADADGLAAHGVGYLPLDLIRPRLSHRLPTLDAAQFAEEGGLARLMQDPVPAPLRGLLISDENLIGTCGGLLQSGELYGGIEGRMRQLRALLGDHPVHVFFSIRSYADFLASAYCEAIVGMRQFLPFANFRDNLKQKSLRWPLVLERIERGLQPASMRIWRFEDLRQKHAAILRTMAFDAPDAFSGAPRSERASFSQAAIDFLAFADKRLGREAAGKLIPGIGAIAPKAKGFPRFDPWTPDERAAFDRRYAADCRELPASLWLVPPQARQMADVL